MLLLFQGVISSRIKPPPPKKILFSFPSRVPVIFDWISEGLCNSSVVEKYLTAKIEKCSTWFFFQLYEPADLGKKIFTTWNALIKSEVYLTCVNFWKFHDHPKACLEVIRLPSWPEIVKLSVKMIFFTFLTPWKCFQVMTNLKFNFSESGAGSVHILPKPIFLFKFSNF